MRFTRVALKAGFLFSTASVLLVSTASASQRLVLCNDASFVINAAIAYRDTEGHWRSEGWWVLSAGSCARVVDTAATFRHFYVHGRRQSGAGLELTGDAYEFCIDPRKAFTILDSSPCRQEGFEAAHFWQVDTGNSDCYEFDFVVSGAPRQAHNNPYRCPAAAPPGAQGETQCPTRGDDGQFHSVEEGLGWCAGDSGHNEGALCGLNALLPTGMAGLPEIPGGPLAEGPLGEIWRRNAMMGAARAAYRAGWREAAINAAVCCQVHNGHMHHCLSVNRHAIDRWLGSGG